eukprot:TRINITY_DN64765_c0_g1_i1.p1 TRINITY_DN64765_c0_g1~~TRINITY_DN64765_c0_g1_i1.p1  ORF type:complete len:750 (-),score=157.36 TRINITY_DN64765_c0_g1_i1:85-2334(-)
MALTTTALAEIDVSSDHLGGPCLTDFVDALEKGLSAALSAYRDIAEECLLQHLEALEHAQISHAMELSKVRAENGLLREQLGLPGQAQQPVLFQEKEPDPAEKKERGNRRAARGDDDDEHDDGGGLSIMKGRKQAGQPAGTWQNFVAWVPNGASLATPMPWQPLGPQDVVTAMQQLTGTPQRSGASNKAGLRGQKSNAWDATEFPGVVPHVHRGDSEDGDDGGDGRSQDEKPFVLYELWKPSSKEQRKSDNKSCRDSETESSYSGMHDNEDEFFQRPRLIINPDSNVRICWDLLSLIMVVYDMILIPMMLFDLPEEAAFLVTMAWTTRIFWTLDMGWSSCTGIVLEDGTVEYRWKLIMKRYAKSWMSLDFFIVASDWAGLIFASGGVNLGRLARASRVVRVVRLLRLVRMQEIIANMMERIQSDNITVVIHICKRLIFMVFSSHVIACLWFGLGDNGVGEDSWVVHYAYKTEVLGDQYLISLHWALSQFAGGIEQITPVSFLERFFAVVVCSFTFTAVMVMVSSFTSTLTHRYIIGGNGARQVATLKLYLKQNHIPKNLTKRVCRNAKHALSGDLTQERVDLLSVISEPLKKEISFEMYSRILGWHPFFRDCLHDGAQMMQRVCNVACSMLLLAEKDVVFSLGEEPPEPKMYMVVAGSLEYLDAQGETTIVTAKTWLAEPCLWTQWQHQGTLTATSNVKLTMLDSNLFQDVCKRYMRKPSPNGFTPKRYAGEYVSQLNQQTFLSDLPER